MNNVSHEAYVAYRGQDWFITFAESIYVKCISFVSIHIECFGFEAKGQRNNIVFDLQICANPSNAVCFEGFMMMMMMKIPFGCVGGWWYAPFYNPCINVRTTTPIRPTFHLRHGRRVLTRETNINSPIGPNDCVAFVPNSTVELDESLFPGGDRWKMEDRYMVWIFMFVFDFLFLHDALGSDWTVCLYAGWKPGYTIYPTSEILGFSLFTFFSFCYC